MNGKLTEIIKPIGTKIGEVTQNVKTTYKTSENTYVKSFRQFTTEAESSINEGFEKKNEADPSEKP